VTDRRAELEAAIDRIPTVATTLYPDWLQERRSARLIAPQIAPTGNGARLVTLSGSPAIPPSPHVAGRLATWIRMRHTAARLLAASTDPTTPQREVGALQTRATEPSAAKLRRDSFRPSPPRRSRGSRTS
jgi:hypothetical protein